MQKQNEERWEENYSSLCGNMSRVGKLPVMVPSQVSVDIGSDRFTVKGPKGELSQDYRKNVQISADEASKVYVRALETDKKSRALHGLYRQLLQNMVIGVSEGFKKVLILQGVGYRAELSTSVLTLSLGYSLPIEYVAPQGITITVEKQTRITIEGIDKQVVGQVAAEIRSIRPPEVYKGKGVRYENEHIRRKAGKSGVKK